MVKSASWTDFTSPLALPVPPARYFSPGWLYFYGTDDGIGFVSEEEKQRRKNIMPRVVKVIELLSESPTSWEEAAKNVVKEASKTLRNIRSVYIKEFTVAVENDKVASYRINAKVTFDLEKDRSGK